MTFQVSDTKSLLSLANELSRKIPSCEKQNSLRLECMHGLGIHTTHIKVDNRIMKWIQSLTHGEMIIPKSNVYDIKITGYSPFPEIISNNITQDDSKCYIDLKPALKFDLFSIEVQYRMDKQFLDRLVTARTPHESFEDKVKYELSAQLKNPAGLQMGFSEVDIEEFPVSARINVVNHINTKIPSYVKELLDLEYKIMNNKNPRNTPQIIVYNHRKAALMKKMGNSSVQEKMEDLLCLLNPSNFINYLQTLEDFKLDQCQRGSEFIQALGVFQLPKTMEVISRTDLSLKKPAAKGQLIYDLKKFEENISSTF